MWESWCDFELSVDPSRPPDPVEVAAAAPQSGVRGSVAPPSVHGLRYRLEAIDPTGTTPLPSNGKIVVKVCRGSVGKCGEVSERGDAGLCLVFCSVLCCLVWPVVPRMKIEYILRFWWLSIDLSHPRCLFPVLSGSHSLIECRIRTCPPFGC